MPLNKEALFDAVESNAYDLGKAIFLMRRATGINRQDFAKKIGVTRRTLEEIEQGRGNPTLKTLEKILGVFGFVMALKRK